MHLPRIPHQQSRPPTPTPEHNTSRPHAAFVPQRTSLNLVDALRPPPWPRSPCARALAESPSIKFTPRSLRASSAPSRRHALPSRFSPFAEQHARSAPPRCCARASWVAVHRGRRETRAARRRRRSNRAAPPRSRSAARTASRGGVASKRSNGGAPRAASPACAAGAFDRPTAATSRRSRRVARVEFETPCSYCVLRQSARRRLAEGTVDAMSTTRPRRDAAAAHSAATRPPRACGRISCDPPRRPPYPRRRGSACGAAARNDRSRPCRRFVNGCGGAGR